MISIGVKYIGEIYENYFNIFPYNIYILNRTNSFISYSQVKLNFLFVENNIK